MQVWNNGLLVAQFKTNRLWPAFWGRTSNQLFRLVLVLCLFLACLIMTSNAQAANRSLPLFNPHTKATTTIPYKRNGRFDADGLRKLNRFLRDWRRNEITQMDPALFDLIWQVYKETGAKKPIHVVSGYRSPATNNMLRRRSRGVAKQSRHTKGQAMDFYLPGVPIKRIREVGLRMQAGGVGYYPRSNSPFVHIDTGNVRHWPRMTRKQLVRVFPRGNTVHVPTDGKPLKGYKQAKVKVARQKAAMVRSSRSVSRFTQIAKAAPAKPSRTQVANLAKNQQNQARSNSLLNNLLGRTPKQRPTPPAAPNVAAPVELAPAAAPVRLAVLPKARAPQPAKRPIVPAPIELATNDQQENGQQPDQNPLQERIELASLPRPRPAQLTASRDFTLASGPKTEDGLSGNETSKDDGRITLASLPKGSPVKQQALAGFKPLARPDQPLDGTAKQSPSQANAPAVIASLTDTGETSISQDRFSYAAADKTFVAQLPSSAPRRSILSKSEEDETTGGKPQQLASLPNAKPKFAPNSKSSGQATQQRPAQQQARVQAPKDQLAKLTFAYGPSSMAHFAHIKQSAKTATFARLSRPAPASLKGLVSKPDHMIDQSFSRKPLNLVSSNGFSGRAIAPMAIRRFN
jgi:uncharacterized protein YcbK (DUF882 family)